MKIKVKRVLEKAVVWISRPNLEKLPFRVLFLGFLLTVLLTFRFARFYWYDEILLTNISGHDIKGIFEAISTTPHPAGFYIFLKLFDVRNVLKAKLSAIFVYYIAIFIITYHAHCVKIIDNYKLSIGLALFFASAVNFLVSSQVKHDILTFPALYLLVLSTFRFFDKKNSRQAQLLLFSNIVALFLLFTGYLPYLLGIGIIFVQVLLSRRKKLGITFLVLQVFILSVYYVALLHAQIVNNQGRLDWIKEGLNDPLNGLSMHITGIPASNVLTVLALLFMLFFLGVYLYRFFAKEKKGQFEKFTVLMTAILLFFSYFTRSFVRPRYSALFFFLVCIIAGWGMGHFIKERKKVYLLVVLYFVFNFSIFGAKFVIVQRASLYTYSKVKDFTKESKVLLLAKRPQDPIVRKVDWRSENLVPVNVYYPKIFDGVRNITSRQLAIKADPGKDITDEQIRTVLGEYGLKRAIYVPFRFSGKEEEYSQELEVLNESCKLYDYFPDRYFMFVECEF